MQSVSMSQGIQKPDTYSKVVLFSIWIQLGDIKNLHLDSQKKSYSSPPHAILPLNLLRYKFTNISFIYDFFWDFGKFSVLPLLNKIHAVCVICGHNSGAAQGEDQYCH